MDEQNILNKPFQPENASTGQVAGIKNPEGTFPLLLVCEHASNFIPKEFNNLGIDYKTSISHAAYDIGIKEVAFLVSEILDAPLVYSRVSRLVIDCNREPYSEDATPKQSEIYSIPGNEAITLAEKEYRIAKFYHPFHDLLHQNIQERPQLEVLLALHSFTPVFYGIDRGMELGVLFDDENILAKTFLESASLFSSLKAVANEPYAPDPKVSHTIRKHAGPRDLSYLMLEVRNSLIREADGQKRIAEVIAKMVLHSLERVRNQD